MKKTMFLVSTLFYITIVNAQSLDTDSVVKGNVTVTKDWRLDILAKKEYEFNKTTKTTITTTTTTTKSGLRAAQGFRLLVVSSNDRNYAMKVRAQLLQSYPEQKVYMSFQAPFIKLKFGNFLDKGDANRYRKMISGSKIVTSNIYVVPEIVEVKPDKNKEVNDDKTQ